MYCTQCGQECKQGDNVCTQCGNRLRGEEMRHTAYRGATYEVKPYAGFWIRFGAHFIDGLIMMVAIIVLSIMLGVIMGVGSVSSIYGPNIVGVMASSIGSLVGLVGGWLYSALFESSEMMATPGKKLVGIKVTDLEGRRITFGRATGRHFGKILSGFILYIGYIMAAFTQKKQALHDIMAGTLIVYKD